jgi:hypothetical protein
MLPSKCCVPSKVPVLEPGFDTVIKMLPSAVRQVAGPGEMGGPGSQVGVSANVSLPVTAIGFAADAGVPSVSVDAIAMVNTRSFFIMRPSRIPLDGREWTLVGT